MKDWADDAADDVINGKGYIQYGQELQDSVAQGLRLMWADGMREAANKLADSVTATDIGWQHIANIIAELRARASEVEKGNP